MESGSGMCLRRLLYCCFFFFSSRRRHTRCSRDWSSDVCSSDLPQRLMDLLFRHETQEGRLLQLDRKTFSKRPVEYCIASRIGEISENDGVLFREVPCLPRPPEQSSRYSRGEHYNGRCDSDLPAANRCDRAHTRGGPSRCPIYPGNRGDKPIPAPRQCLDEPRIIRRIAKSLA